MVNILSFGIAAIVIYLYSKSYRHCPWKFSGQMYIGHELSRFRVYVKRYNRNAGYYRGVSLGGHWHQISSHATYEEAHAAALKLWNRTNGNP